MATTAQIYEYLDQLAPVKLQMSFDNSGFLVGEKGREVNKILVALDITPEVVEEAETMGAELIVSHHPVIFTPVRSVTDGDVTGKILIRLITSHIAAICMHTNLDAVQGGVNDELAKAAGLSGTTQLHADGTDDNGASYGIGRVGTLSASVSFPAFADRIKTALNAGGLRCHDAGQAVFKVAVGGGSCGSMLPDVLRAGCDTFVTSDVKYDVFLEAKALGLNLIDAGHFPTEDLVCDMLVRRLGERFPDLTTQKSRCHRDVVHFL